MYKVTGLELAGIFAMMIIPTNFDNAQSQEFGYGTATIDAYDEQGNQ